MIIVNKRKIIEIGGVVIMANVKFHSGEQIPLEMHKVRIVQKLNLPSVERRLKAITEAGNNTFLLKNRYANG
jgi:tyrosine phenol-lyase